MQNADNGATVCLPLGQTLSVFLKAPLDGPDWATVTTSSTGVLKPTVTGALTLVRGVTGGAFTAVGLGVDRLSSTRPACAPPATCPPESWQVTVVVTSATG